MKRLMALAALILAVFWGAPAGARSGDLVVDYFRVDRDAQSTTIVGIAADRSAVYRYVGVRLNFDLYDAAGQLLGTESVTRPSVAPGESWNFKTEMGRTDVASARIGGIEWDEQIAER